jgi:hypothetical protein
MDFREYDHQSGGSSMHSPTPNRHHPSYQPATTAIIEEVAEAYDPMDPLNYQPALATLLADVPTYTGPRVETVHFLYD